ncbi:hypothetical protein [Aurantiacibacter marinus]|uniref:hypothetical protein n=1 Tax=Aurantiacibacter marinus TaxID=874156 RepID=UPI00069BD4BB|nr:hypothetical protein [Aurantiacibacter marinus]
MITKPSKITTGAALAAALSMVATPAAAVDLPYIGVSDVAVQTGAAEEQNQHRYRHRRHRDRGIDAGDVIAGVLVLGTIAAIAGSGRNRDRDRVRDRDYRDRDYRDRDDRRNRDERRNYDSSGLDNAAEMCADQVERGNERVEEISSARRTADGWRVAGTLSGGEGWSCWIDNDGRIRNVDLGVPGYSYEADANYGSSASAAPAGDQWDDGAYARARATTRTAADSEYTYRAQARYTPENDGPQPAYPGGPLPGEEGYGDASQDEGDGRYATAEAPDFPQRGN